MCLPLGWLPCGVLQSAARVQISSLEAPLSGIEFGNQRQRARICWAVEGGQRKAPALRGEQGRGEGGWQPLQCSHCNVAASCCNIMPIGNVPLPSFVANTLHTYIAENSIFDEALDGCNNRHNAYRFAKSLFSGEVVRKAPSIHRTYTVVLPFSPRDCWVERNYGSSF